MQNIKITIDKGIHLCTDSHKNCPIIAVIISEKINLCIVVTIDVGISMPNEYLKQWCKIIMTKLK